MPFEDVKKIWMNGRGLKDQELEFRIFCIKVFGQVNKKTTSAGKTQSLNGLFRHLKLATSN